MIPYRKERKHKNLISLPNWILKFCQIVLISVDPMMTEESIIFDDIFATLLLVFQQYDLNQLLFYIMLKCHYVLLMLIV